MNRLLICIILLLINHAVLAEKLYRWVEADGSITFSPNPPPAGVDYKAVNAAHNNAAKAELPALKQKPSILATSEHALDERQPNTAINQLPTQAAPAAATQKLEYAPDTGITRSASNQPAVVGADSSQSAIPVTRSVADSQKRRQCQDLYKRVVSLERRMRSPLEPVDMDNTVIAMARYQRSYDRHCVD